MERNNRKHKNMKFKKGNWPNKNRNLGFISPNPTIGIFPIFLSIQSTSASCVPGTKLASGYPEE